MSAIVTDASRRAGLAIVRSLGRKGIVVTAADSVRVSAAFFSRYCRYRAIYPSPEKNVFSFLEYMIKLVRSRKFDVLIPQHDLVTVPISRCRNRLDRFVRLPIPDYETVVKAHSKAETLRLALEHDVPCPQTYFIDRLSEVRRISERIEYPVVIKPRSSTIWHGSEASTILISRENYVNSPKELILQYKKVHERSEFPLIQEFIPGEGYGVSALLNHSDPRAVFAYKRLREYPITGGPSTLRVSISDERLIELGLRILKALNWHGVAMVEFKVDSRDHTPKLMEVNGRFWGSLALPIASGVDFPYLLYKMTVEGDIKPVFSYRVGVKCRWLIPGDFLYLLSSLAHSTSRWETIRNFVRFYESNLHYDEFCLDDPWPIVGMTATAFRYLCDLLGGSRSLVGEYLQRGRSASCNRNQC